MRSLLELRLLFPAAICLALIHCLSALVKAKRNLKHLEYEACIAKRSYFMKGMTMKNELGE